MPEELAATRHFLKVIQRHNSENACKMNKERFMYLFIGGVKFLLLLIIPWLLPD